MRIELEEEGDKLEYTALKRDAEIYSLQRERTEREKWKSMNNKERWEYFKEYYLKIVIAASAAIVFVGYFIFTMVKPKAVTIFYAAVMYNSISSEAEENLKTELEELLNADGKKQEVYIDDNYINGISVGMSSMDRIQTYMFSGQIDVVITDFKTFEMMTKSGGFLDLADLFPTEIYSQLEDKLYMGKVDNQDNREKAYGLRLSGLDKYEELGITLEDPVIGVVSNTKYKDNAVKVIEHLYELDRAVK